MNSYFGASLFTCYNLWHYMSFKSYRLHIFRQSKSCRAFIREGHLLKILIFAVLLPVGASHFISRTNLPGQPSMSNPTAMPDHPTPPPHSFLTQHCLIDALYPLPSFHTDLFLLNRQSETNYRR